jgi:hypothetical protein
MIIRTDITAGLPKRELTQPYVPEMALGETLTVLKGVLIEVTLQKHPQQTSDFITKITDKFNLGLDILHMHDTSGFGVLCAMAEAGRGVITVP